MINRRNLLLLITTSPALVGCVAARHSPLDENTGREYTVGPGDRLRVVVFGQADLSNLYTIDSVGSITLPLGGTVEVSGKTAREIERVVTQRLSAGFLRDPHVAVEIDEYRPFFIMGEVASAGAYPFMNGLTVRSAVAIAGGFTPRAVRRSVELSRSIEGNTETASVPMMFPVQPGDTIVVLERWL